jgi:hypothetical protein
MDMEVVVPSKPEAEFLDVIGTKVVRALLFTVISTKGFYSPLLRKNVLILVCFVYIIFGNLTSSLRTLKIMLRNLNEIVRS